MARLFDWFRDCPTDVGLRTFPPVIGGGRGIEVSIDSEKGFFTSDCIRWLRLQYPALQVESPLPLDADGSHAIESSPHR